MVFDKTDTTNMILSKPEMDRNCIAKNGHGQSDILAVSDRAAHAFVGGKDGKFLLTSSKDSTGTIHSVIEYTVHCIASHISSLIDCNASSTLGW